VPILWDTGEENFLTGVGTGQSHILSSAKGFTNTRVLHPLDFFPPPQGEKRETFSRFWDSFFPKKRESRKISESRLYLIFLGGRFYKKVWGFLSYTYLGGYNFGAK